MLYFRSMTERCCRHALLHGDFPHSGKAVCRPPFEPGLFLSFHVFPLRRKPPEGVAPAGKQPAAKPARTGRGAGRQRGQGQLLLECPDRQGAGQDTELPEQQEQAGVRLLVDAQGHCGKGGYDHAVFAAEDGGV